MIAGGNGAVSARAESASSAPRARKLRLKARAERMGETRQRIARATYELHASVGPGRTTISAIAERAGVQRLTVYKHFPNDRELFQACTTYGLELDPPPAPPAWSAIADPEARLRHALAELYAYFRRNETLLTNVERDVPRILADLEVGPPPSMQEWMSFPGRWHAALASAWPDADAQTPLRHAALALAVDFATWRTLTQRQQLDDARVTDLMLALVICAAESR